MQPFAGIPTFMRLPASRDLQDIDVTVVGIPFDSGTSYRSGTRFGPRKIREASLLLWGHNTTLDITPTEKLRIIDYGDVDIVPVDIEATMGAITSEVGQILKNNCLVVSLGGDHSITLPLLRAHAAKHGPLAVVQFDSHPDTWDQEYQDQPYSHATPFRRALEEGLIDADAYIQVGIRGSVSSPSIYEDTRRLGVRLITIHEALETGITIHEALETGIPSVIKEIHQAIGEKPTYISLDIDVVDPAYAPGTGTPEVGGVSSYQAMQLVRGLQGLNLVGFDLVEVCPPYDHGEITATLAANLVFEFLSLVAIQGDALD
jgi:agmatinase/guanidinopropionase